MKFLYCQPWIIKFILLKSTKISWPSKWFQPIWNIPVNAARPSPSSLTVSLKREKSCLWFTREDGERQRNREAEVEWLTSVKPRKKEESCSINEGERKCDPAPLPAHSPRHTAKQTTPLFLLLTRHITTPRFCLLARGGGAQRALWNCFRRKRDTLLRFLSFKEIEKRSSRQTHRQEVNVSVCCSVVVESECAASPTATPLAQGPLLCRERQRSQSCVSVQYWLYSFIAWSIPWGSNRNVRPLEYNNTLLLNWRRNHLESNQIMEENWMDK